MFITENQNVAESILFLLSAREALSYMVEESSVDHKEELKNFLMNEASDYEIMHMLMHEEMPNEKYDFANEVRLFSDLKEQVLMNFNTIGKYLGEGAVTFINKVDTVYPEFSSAAPILEFQLETQDHVLNEVFDKEGVGIQKLVDYFTSGEAAKNVSIAAKGLLKSIGKPAADALAAGNKKLAMLKLTNKGVDTATANKMFSIVGKKVAHTKDAVARAASGADADALKHSVNKAGILATIKAKAIAAAPALQKAVTSQAGMAVGGAALAALALYASVKVYKRFMSKAAKSCAGQSGSAKTMCMKKYQHGAIAAQVKDLGSAMNACAKSKTPEKCKVPIQKKISKLQVKMQKMKANMAA